MDDQEKQKIDVIMKDYEILKTYSTPVGKKVKQFESDLLLSFINLLRMIVGSKGLNPLKRIVDESDENELGFQRSDKILNGGQQRSKYGKQPDRQNKRGYN